MTACDPETAARASVLRGRLYTLLSLRADDAAFGALQADADAAPGPDHGVSLLIKAVRQQQLSYRRPVAESVSTWGELRREAAASLPVQDPTLLLIRSHYIRFLRLQGRPEDLDQAVALREEEVATREAHLSPGDSRLGIARADLAVALIDRARTTARCGGQHADPDADLARAEDLLYPEIKRRARHDETLLPGSRLIHSELYLGLAERALARGDRAGSLDHASTGHMIAWYLVRTNWERDRRSLGALKSRLLLAESLALSDQPADGARAARLACHVAGLVAENVDRGWPLFVLARMQRELDPGEARRTAGRALEERVRVFPQESCRVREVREFIGSLGAGENESPGPIADLYQVRIAGPAHSRGIGFPLIRRKPCASIPRQPEQTTRPSTTGTPAASTRGRITGPDG